MFPLGLFGSRSRVDYQPLGVIGCISPWNFPVQLTFAPLAGVFSAGNRTMIKPSEFTPLTSELMKEAFTEYFNIEEVAVFTGGPEVGSAFSSLPFDHLIFTGATSVARHVMRAAAENLVPLTLETRRKIPGGYRQKCGHGLNRRQHHDGQNHECRTNLPRPRLRFRT